MGTVQLTRGLRVDVDIAAVSFVHSWNDDDNVVLDDASSLMSGNITQRDLL